MTPRALADDGSKYSGLDEHQGALLIRDHYATLRIAAKQIEAVQQIAEYVAREYEEDPALDAMIGGLIARSGQEPTDICYNCHGEGYLDGGYPGEAEPCHACGGSGAVANPGEDGFMTKPLKDIRGLDDPAPERCRSVLYVAKKQSLTRCHGTVGHIGTHWAGASTIWAEEEATYYLVSDD